MNTAESIKWVLERGARTGPYGLDRIKFLTEELDNPQREFSCILIGGTNGKGSVAAIVEAIMNHCDEYLSACFTSPHLLDLRERIRIGGESICEKLFCRGVEEIKTINSIMSKESSIGPASFFETITALALWSFRETEIDLAILEVGLGGRLDSTNICEPEISVITNIGTDHQEFLGEGKISIAREKLGIVRKNRPLITAEISPEVFEEFEKHCKPLNSQIIRSEASKFFSIIESKENGHLIKTIFSEDEIFFKLPGAHQLENLATALETINQLRSHGFQIADEAIALGLKNVCWPGRLQWLDGSPPVLLDGAHNAEGLEALIKYLSSFPVPKPMNIILGALKEKPIAAMAESLKPFGHKLCFAKPGCGRALTEEEFLSMSELENWEWFPDFNAAFDFCKADLDRTVLVTGSLYLISDALKRLKKHV